MVRARPGGVLRGAGGAECAAAELRALPYLRDLTSELRRELERVTAERDALRAQLAACRPVHCRPRRVAARGRGRYAMRGVIGAAVVSLVSFAAGLLLSGTFAQEPTPAWVFRIPSGARVDIDLSQRDAMAIEVDRKPFVAWSWGAGAFLRADGLQIECITPFGTDRLECTAGPSLLATAATFYPSDGDSVSFRWP